ncbi:phosphopantetheine-binding protein [Catenulispora subtropica]|uniref:Carrier domain-containing protein n=1 Tax=Catenulispora subtropica TaxID=450798 RepID=A0ABN2TD30_9ACTN
MTDSELLDTIHERWCEVLDSDRAEPGEDFFHSGGNSLLAVRLTGALREDLGVKIPIAALFEARELGAYTAKVRALVTSAR